MPCQPRCDAPGTLHHGILCGLERGRSVTEAEGRAAFVTRLGAVATATGTRLSAVRARLAVRMVTQLGLSLAEAVRHLGSPPRGSRRRSRAPSENSSTSSTTCLIPKNKFRKLGFSYYNDGLEVHSSPLNIILHD